MSSSMRVESPQSSGGIRTCRIKRWYRRRSQLSTARGAAPGDTTLFRAQPSGAGGLTKQGWCPRKRNGRGRLVRDQGALSIGHLHPRSPSRGAESKTTMLGEGPPRRGLGRRRGNQRPSGACRAASGRLRVGFAGTTTRQGIFQRREVPLCSPIRIPPFLPWRSDAESFPERKAYTADRRKVKGERR